MAIYRPTSHSNFVIYLILCYILISMKNICRILAVFLSSLVFILLSAFPAHAVFIQSGNIIDLPKDKKIDETVLVSGGTLTVDSDINGDLLCAAKDVIVNGNIKGDILCVAQSIKVNGDIDGNVRVIAQNVEIAGLVTRNLYSLAQNLSLSKFSSVKGDIFFGVQNVDLRGALGRDLLGAGEKLDISGSLFRNAKVTATKIAVYDPAKIGGNFEYYIDDSGIASISAGNVKGEIIRHQIVRQMPDKPVQDPKPYMMFFGKIYTVLTYIVLGLALLYFLKKGVEDRTGILVAKPFVTGLTGLAVLILTPLVFILLLKTFIGVPLAFVLILEYVLAIITATVYPTIVLGWWIMKSIVKSKQESYIWSLVVGAVSMGILISIPFLGFFVGFIALCLGLGAIFISYLPKK